MSFTDPTGQPEEVETSETGDPSVDALLDQPVEAGEPLIPRSRVRSLEKKARRVEDAESQARTLARELAFTRAGIDTETRVGKMFAETYKGEMTKEAVLAEWAEVSGNARPTESGELGTQGEGAEVATEVGDMNAHRATASSPGANIADGTTIEPPVRETAIAAARKDLADGAPRDVAMGDYVNRLANAAQKGDQSVIIPSR